MTEEELIQLVRNGAMCKAFGCTMERLFQNSNIDSYVSLKCKYCGKDSYASWEQKT